MALPLRGLNCDMNDASYWDIFTHYWDKSESCKERISTKYDEKHHKYQIPNK
ncbi:hypothetical protein MACH17_04870 [Phaeobacter inhibens]|nr:hypothetical protein MACH17_04870 [Phaeobacter inhibens]